jgi:hypothetical protein
MQQTVRDTSWWQQAQIAHGLRPIVQLGLPTTALRIGTNVIGFPSLDNKLWLENSYLWALALLL